TLQATPPLTLYEGGRGFAVFTPVVKDGRHEGYVSAEFRMAPLIRRSVARSVRDRFHLKIVDGTQLVYESSPERRLEESPYTNAVQMTVAGRRWTLVLDPKPEVVATYTSLADELMLGLSALLAVGMAVLAWWLLESREKLRQSETRFRGIVKDLPDLVCRFEPDTTLTFVNEEYAEYFGKSPEELVGTSFLELIPADQHEETLDHLALLERGESVSTNEHEVLAAGGQVRWQRWRNRALRGEDGTLTEIQSIGVDVTESKHSEIALRESERKLRTIFDAVRDGIAILDEKGAVLEVNERVCELTGYSKRELLRHGAGEVILSDPAVAASDLVPWLERLADEAPSELPCWRAVHESGRPWWAEIDVCRARIDSADRFVTVIRDVSGRMQLEEQLRHSQKLQAVGTLAAGVAHDFNNIITAVLGFGETAYELTEDRPDARFALGGIRQACEQAEGVTRSLLTFSRHAATDKRPTELCDLMRGTIRLLHHMLPAAVEIRAEIPRGEGIWCLADESQIRQVIMNLALNARDALQDGGTIRIRIRPEAELPACRGGGQAAGCEDKVCLSIEDDGAGMSQEVSARATEPFFTTKPRERGTGLGLSVAHGIITEHGGEILIDSSEGVGTSVHISLPCCPAPHDDPEPARQPRPEIGRGETVLVVEDNEQVRAVIARTLERSAYRVIESADGNEGMMLLRNQRGRVGLVILDIDLPKKSGIACLDEIRIDEPRLPAILISGLPGQGKVRHGDPRTVFLQKPFKVTELATVVAELLSPLPTTSS
ncbi:MAG: PAS domain S-box protein, partial [Acidobacteriota bacterium]|nr:PAS domain S-box protein [Acidobacteriota bacterium]